MKLYATTTSERASKGQGGNQFLDISLYYGKKENNMVGSIHMHDNGQVIFLDMEKKKIELIKAKRQKSEMPSSDNADAIKIAYHDSLTC